jgi:DNA-binding NarL/FixJ family response regulator
MTLNYISGVWRDESDQINLVDELEYALSHCWDLPVLQISSLTQLPAVLERAHEETDGLELAKALRKELIACAEQLTQRSVYPINEIIGAIDNGQLGNGSQTLARIKREVGIPFSRNKVDLARYYAIRLAMQGTDHQIIAEFLEVDPRTVANYIAQAKERIRVVLESQSMLIKAFGMEAAALEAGAELAAH